MKNLKIICWQYLRREIIENFATLWVVFTLRLRIEAKLVLWLVENHIIIGGRRQGKKCHNFWVLIFFFLIKPFYFYNKIKFLNTFISKNMYLKMSFIKYEMCFLNMWQHMPCPQSSSTKEAKKGKFFSFVLFHYLNTMTIFFFPELSFKFILVLMISFVNLNNEISTHGINQLKSLWCYFQPIKHHLTLAMTIP